MNATQLFMFVEPEWIIENAWPLDATAATPNGDMGDSWATILDAWDWIMDQKELDLGERVYEGIDADGVMEPVWLRQVNHRGESEYAPDDWNGPMLIDGHHRVTAASQHGHSYVPVVWGVSEEEVSSLWDDMTDHWLDATNAYRNGYSS